MSEAEPSFPAERSELLLPGPAGLLEVAVDHPEPEIARAGVAVLCHPHPLHGGTMHNKVVTMLERSLRECGLSTVRFNFRGVGRSEGVFDQGRGETQDAIAVAEWVRRARPHDALWLGGFSFGAYVSARAAQTLPVACLISIAPPVESWDFDSLARPECPWIIVQGSEDDVVSVEAVRRFVESLEPPPYYVEIPDTGHFFHRRLMDLRGVLKHAVRPHLPPLRQPA
ncbi:MAG: alpha/beta hydrolase [Lysobacterales bacterium]|jgi:alpha/beta superfamily hydrolase|nr:MAG: alpha/beta hydrolase [Xanthomonadales bacterium]